MAGFAYYVIQRNDTINDSINWYNVCVCVCVCERANEWEREIGGAVNIWTIHIVESDIVLLIICAHIYFNNHSVCIMFGIVTLLTAQIIGSTYIWTMHIVEPGIVLLTICPHILFNNHSVLIMFAIVTLLPDQDCWCFLYIFELCVL